MTYTSINVEEFLGAIAPFNQLSETALKELVEQVQLLRYRIGQAILTREKMPTQIYIIFEGKARLLGYDPKTGTPVTLKLGEPGQILGWVGLTRNIPCETAIASGEMICLTLPAFNFLALLRKEKGIASYFQSQPSLIEVFDLVGAELQRRADSHLIMSSASTQSLKDLALQVYPQAQIINGLTGSSTGNLSSDYFWLISGGSVGKEVVGERYNLNDPAQLPPGSQPRLLGVPIETFAPTTTEVHEAPTRIAPVGKEEIPYAPDEPPEVAAPEEEEISNFSPGKYPHVRGKGELGSILACFQMLSQHLKMPFRREVVRKVLVNQQQRTGSLSLQHCGAVAELVGLRAQMLNVPMYAIGRLEAPAIIDWKGNFALLYEITPKYMVLGIPEKGVLKQKTTDVMKLLTVYNPPPEDTKQQHTCPVLLLKATQETPQRKFGLSWFLPSLVKYRRVLIEVFIASFFFQLFGLANPLITQVIIDKVIIQNSAGTLQVLGMFLVVVALFEALLGTIRTYLFVDTTNRIDLTLGSEIIDHLLRLPLRYFEKRPVGELATRVNELEKIRQFLTGTALTVVLDAVFSVIYIVVMFIYSWILTLVALATLPLFILLTVIFSPIVRRQLRTKAERNAEAQSHLVEVLSGIQTVKAQNVELRSRWRWQERYSRYVSAGFKTVLTSTAASSSSNFLNKLSGLLVLWVGAYLVLQQELTLGQLIAFRIIAGYVTTPLLRLTQLWQNFQETALSLERLSDIIDSPQEATEEDRGNIPLPTVEGSVKYENVSFRFKSSGPLQLDNINLEFEPGLFVGIVGQSGSGKSTLMKLLPRLYPLESGRILIDGYDINKVELYSLRQQIGIVPQDTLLFEGSVQENIALNYPDATVEEIIEVAKIAAAHEFIMGLPNGYNTRVGERGSALSGGQRQRVAIARTILQNPRMLIMDEATSALDYESERQVCLNLAEAFKGRTVFFITHRLTTIRNADRILMLDKGAVVEQGTHQELMNMRGRYFCLYQQQDAQL